MAAACLIVYVAQGADQVNVNSWNQLWFAVQVRYRQEFVTANRLEERGYRQFVPSYFVNRRWSDRVKKVKCPLFSGYVFCQFNADAVLPIISTPGVIRIVGNRNEPLPLSHSELSAIQRVIGASSVVEPCEYLDKGTKVRISSGPLAGLEGIVESHKGRQRLVLSVHLVHRSIAVEVNESSITQACAECSGNEPTYSTGFSLAA
jgi:transcriptional antiterminator NusG